VSGFSINRVVISGNLTRDPELRATPSGTELCKMRIAAVTGRKKNDLDEWNDTTGFFDVTIWGGFGAWQARNLHQGDQVVVEGKLNWHEWETDEGAKRSQVDIVVTSMDGSCIPVPRRDGAVQRAPSSDVPAASTNDFTHGTPAETAAATDYDDVKGHVSRW
jgi:single-strand DNA-binding protein